MTCVVGSGGNSEEGKEKAPPVPSASTKVRFDAANVERAKKITEPLAKDTMNFGIPTDDQASRHVKEQHGAGSWEYRVLKFLHQTKAQIFFASLLVLDVVLLFVELALLTIYPSCSVIERDAISCCPAVTQEEDNVNRLLAGSGGKPYYQCASGLAASFEYPATCDTHKWHRVHTAEKVMFSMTMAILSIFMLELIAKMVAIKPHIFFRQAFYALDFFIVSISLALEATFFALNDVVAQSLVGLIIVIRAWRFIRISHGIIEVVGEITHHKHQTLLAYTEELEELMLEAGMELPSGKICPHDQASSSNHGNHHVEAIEKHHRMKQRQRHLSHSASTLSRESSRMESMKLKEEPEEP